MKRIAFLLVFLVTIQDLIAQPPTNVPNPGFETWVTDTIEGSTYLEPQGWSSTNPATDIYSFYSKLGITQDTIAYSGNYAVEISTVFIGPVDSAQPYAGILTNGVFTNNFVNIVGGTPFNYLPDSVYFYYQYSSSAEGNGLMVAYFLKNNNGSLDTVGFAFDTIPAASNYTKAALPVYRTDSGTAQPDSILMIFISCTNPADPLDGHLVVDDISFGGPYTGISNVQPGFSFNVFPNPADDHFLIQTPTDASAINSVTVYRTDGKMMMHTSNTDPVRQLNMDTGELQPGNYIVRVRLDDGSSAQRLIMIAR